MLALWGGLRLVLRTAGRTPVPAGDGRSLLLCEVVSSPFLEVCEAECWCQVFSVMWGSWEPWMVGVVDGEGWGVTFKAFSTPESLEFHLSVRGQALQTCSSFDALPP